MFPVSDMNKIIRSTVKSIVSNCSEVRNRVKGKFKSIIVYLEFVFRVTYAPSDFMIFRHLSSSLSC